MVGNANTLIGMGKEPAEVGFFAESESVLEMEGNNLYVTDLETRNGTRVNGVVIRGKYKLERYDEIVAGNIKFRIEW